MSPSLKLIAIAGALALCTTASAAPGHSAVATVAAGAGAAQAAASSGTAKIVTVGDGTIVGSRIRPFEYQRHQCARDEQGWKHTGVLTERATVTGEGDDRRLRLEHEATRPDGTHVQTVMLYERDTLAPLQVSTAMKNETRGRSGRVHYVLSPDGYTGERARGDQVRALSGKIASTQYNGTTLGLVLAAADLERDLPLELPASMLAFDASYRVIATDAGTEMLTLAGQPVEARRVDVEWHHLEEGDIYPPGPDASGGRYWIVSDPPAGLPYVARYQTDTFVVEFERRICPPEG